MHEKKRIAFILTGCVVFVILSTLLWLSLDKVRGNTILHYIEGWVDPDANKTEAVSDSSEEDSSSSGPDSSELVTTDTDPGNAGIVSGDPSVFPDSELVIDLSGVEEASSALGLSVPSGTDSGTSSDSPSGSVSESDSGNKTNPDLSSDSSADSGTSGNPDSLKQNSSDSSGNPDPAAGNNSGDGNGSGSYETGEIDTQKDRDGSHAEASLPDVSDPNLGGENELAKETKESPALYAEQDNFSPAEADLSAGVPATDLLAHMRSLDSSYTRSEDASAGTPDEDPSGNFKLGLIGYAAGDVYEVSTPYGQTGTVATLYYYFPTGTVSRRGDLVYDEDAELPRMEDALAYLLPEHADDVVNDFRTMRMWQETYRKATGETEIPWSGYIRSRYYGTRYCRMALSYNSLIVKIYPTGYVDENGDFADKGSYREFYNYPIR